MFEIPVHYLLVNAFYPRLKPDVCVARATEYMNVNGALYGLGYYYEDTATGYPIGSGNFFYRPRSPIYTYPIDVTP